MRSIQEIVRELKIPTRPNYDFEGDTDQGDYVNPVVANNKIILFTNALFELTEGNLEQQKQMDIVRRNRSRAEHKQNSIRLRILSQNPIPSTSAKNLALTEAFVLTCLLAEGPEPHTEYLALLESINRSDRIVERLERMLESLSRTAKMVEMACQNIQTHLSYVKKEQEWSGRT